MSIGPQTRGGRLRIRLDRVIYTTITLLAVLIIYDGWEQLRFWDVVTVIVGPILAIFMGHVFRAGAELTGWALVLSIASGLVLGGIILVLQALLQPGHEPFRP